MAIDYRAEVDSGFDRKVMVEGVVEELLRNGLPIDIIETNPNFNIRHREMVNNLRKGYASKLEQVEDMYDTFYEIPTDGLSESYSEVVHNIPELYPMTKEEEKEKFTLRDKLNTAIEKAKTKESKQIIKKRESCINKIVKLKVKYPILDTIIEMTEEMDVYISEGPLTSEIMDELFKKYNFDKSKFTIYNLIYKKYEGYMNELSELNSKIEQSERGLVTNEEIEKMIEQRNQLEEELIKRNLKLVNYFIREKYKKLLVEQEELQNVCLLGLTECMRKFDASKGFRFSTFAIRGMDMAVKHSFKELTGYSWINYWKTKEIQVLIDYSSRLLGRRTTVQDLLELGMIDMSYKVATGYADMISVHLDSYVYGDEYGDKDDENLTTFEQYASKDESDDMRYGNNATEADEVEMVAILTTLQDNLSGVLDTLTDREKIVIVLRFGLDREKFLGDLTRKYLSYLPNAALSLDEVGKVFHVTRERIRQIEAKALRKLRHPSRSKKLKDYLDVDYKTL